MAAWRKGNRSTDPTEGGWQWQPMKRGCTSSGLQATRHKDNEEDAPGWALTPAGTSTPQTQHPPPCSSLCCGQAVPLGSREDGGSRGPAASLCHAPAISCSCHITILPRACLNNQCDCGGRKPEGHGDANRAILIRELHTAPHCPVWCPPSGTSGLGWVPCPNLWLHSTIPSHLNPHPVPWSFPRPPSALPLRDAHDTDTTPHRDHAASLRHQPCATAQLPLCCCPCQGSKSRCQLRSHALTLVYVLEKGT